MKILVTGASGGMAGYLIDALINKGLEVVATSRSEQKIKHEPFFTKITYKPYDLASHNTKDLFTYFGKPDSVLHLAWDKLTEPKNEIHLTQILEDHKIFLENLITNGLKDVNVLGTVYEYGMTEGELNEDMPPAPVIPYAQAKNALREHLQFLQGSYPFSLKWIRIFNVFSEGKEGRNLYSLLLNAVRSGQESFNMSGGEQVRDYMTAGQVTEVILQIMLQNKVNGIINCASGRPTKLKDLVNNFLKTHNSSMKLNLGHYPYLPYEPMTHWGSTKKLKSVLRDDEFSRKLFAGA